MYYVLMKKLLLLFPALAFASSDQGLKNRDLKKELSPMQYKVTQQDGTEPPFKNKYWNNKEERDFEFDFGSDLEHIILNQLVERESIFYKPGEDKPYTGVITDDNSEAGYLFLGKTKNGKNRQF